MTIRRYVRDGTVLGGKAFGTSAAVNAIRQNIRQANISFTVQNLAEAQRLDVLAGEVYGDASLWWVIAAASDIGWALQVPPGTFLRIPTDLSEIGDLVS